ncbi:Axonemal dynein light chain, putative [Angomonas deanei]|uniref:Axonemal dynein light chain, putative n=1 Tax=Angomonas deanei TaxID=59799 RepID=A0A7G2CK24_9TRYP|nr:Axonemal dynein light chain, putative [Angomonas deanei]
MFPNSQERLEYTYNNDIPLVLTVYDTPICIGQRPLARFTDLLPLLYQQQAYLQMDFGRVGVGAHNKNSEVPPTRTPPLSAPLMEKLKFVVGASPAYNVNFSLLPTGGRYDQNNNQNHNGGENENEVQLKIKNELYRLQCQEDLLDYLFGDEEITNQPHKLELLYGMRLIPPFSDEYFTNLKEWEAYYASLDSTATVSMPSFVNHILSCATQEIKQTNNNNSKDEKTIFQVCRYNYKPFVKSCTPSNVTEVLDSVVPPRQLQFYNVDYDRCVERYKERKKVILRIQEITEYIKQNILDGKEYLNAARSEELRREEQLLAELDLIPEGGIGEVQCLLERPATTVIDRESVLRLEEVLDGELTDSAARGWQQYRRENPVTSNANTSKKLEPIATTTKAKPKSEGPSPGKAAPELNAERTLLQIHLLSEELLRQATVDLPERGVLLRRLLNQAYLSLEAHHTLAMENTALWMKTEILPEDIGEHDPSDPPKSNAALARRRSELEEEVRALQREKATLDRRRQALTQHHQETQAARELKVAQEKGFQETLCDRLKEYTERVKAQERERRPSADGA